MLRIKHQLELKNPKGKSSLRLRFTWGQKEKLAKGKVKYGSVRISTSHTIDPENLESDKQLVGLSNYKTSLIQQDIQRIDADMKKSHQNLLKKFKCNHLITGKLLRNEYDKITGNIEIEYDLPVDIEKSIYEIARIKKLSKSTLTSYKSTFNQLSQWASANGVKLNWITFTTKDYNNFLLSMVEEYKPNTLAGHRKRINAWINAINEAQIPIEVRRISSKTYPENPKPKVILSEEQLIQIADYKCTSRHKLVKSSRKEIEKIFMILLSTGCRISDLYKIIDKGNHRADEEGKLYVDFVAAKNKDNEKRTRVVVPIMNNIEDIVSVTPPKKISEDKIRKGLRNLLYDLFGDKTNVNKNGIGLNVASDFTPHCARATIYTYLIGQNKIPLHLIQQMVGHAQYFGAAATKSYYSEDNFDQAKALRGFLEEIPFFKKQSKFNPEESILSI
jgi:integrase